MTNGQYAHLLNIIDIISKYESLPENLKSGALDMIKYIVNGEDIDNMCLHTLADIFDI